MLRRNGHMFRILALGCFVLASAGLVIGRAAALLPFLWMPVVVLLPGFMVGDGQDEADGPPADGEDDGGGGPPRGPSHPRPAPNRPHGGLPLPTSAPGSWRLRGAGTQRRPALNPRRHPVKAPAPRRTPARH